MVAAAFNCSQRRRRWLLQLLLVDDGTDFWGNRKLGRSEKKGTPPALTRCQQARKEEKEKRKSCRWKKRSVYNGALWYIKTTNRFLLVVYKNSKKGRRAYTHRCVCMISRRLSSRQPLYMWASFDVKKLTRCKKEVAGGFLHFVFILFLNGRTPRNPAFILFLRLRGSRVGVFLTIKMYYCILPSRAIKVLLLVISRVR